MSSISDFSEFHWMVEVIQTVDVGLVVLDRDYSISTWNGFMEAHSGMKPEEVRGKSLFEVFDETDENWFRQKVDPVFLLNNRAFTTWEQRPYIFRFKNYRPITGTTEYMYQNMTVIPLASLTGDVQNICLIIYDMTDNAVNKLALKDANDQLKHLSRTDRLTGLNNRGYWEERLHSEFGRSTRSKHSTSLVMFDIDHFKKINDTYGHPAGDEALRQISDMIRSTLRKTDIAGRYGGEEFGILLLDTDAAQARFFADRLRKKVSQIVINHSGFTFSFTISLGIMEHKGQLGSPKEWIECADKALYAAKEGGRNQVVVYGQ